MLTPIISDVMIQSTPTFTFQSSIGLCLSMTHLGRIFLIFSIFFVNHALEAYKIRRKVKIVPETDSIDKNLGSYNYAEKKQSERMGKFFSPFSLFNVIQFPNTECTTSSGTQAIKF